MSSFHSPVAAPGAFPRRETYERVAIGAIIALLLIFLPAKYFLLAFIVFGQGHFVMTYLYQGKAGKVGWRYLTLYVVALGILLYLVTFVIDLSLLLFITGSVFALHFFYDEARLYARDNGITLALVWHPALLFLLVLVEHLYAVDTLPIAIAATLLWVLQAARRQGSNDAHRATGWYMALFSTILLVALAAPITVPATSLLGAIILYHYLSWYVHYFFRLKDGTRPIRPYLANIAYVNIVIIAGFAGYLLAAGPAREALGLLFDERYFYMWTLLHIFFASNEFLAAVRTQVLARIWRPA
ncbi:MAG TPA: hypothetical protein VFY28_00270 [Candidatus Paceibacterota bacterium]|nr:hypothetical protein [Candidatus Paceibacterota bacterium]